MLRLPRCDKGATVRQLLYGELFEARIVDREGKFAVAEVPTAGGLTGVVRIVV